ncbi:RNA 2',3'-cyclic phosphodiesterase [Candidatus Micrarchaeota archaeon]|nr:RNA 2',3'-cyclic phosphodiesterase [Candidatus Micrarchaeota archaeon]
MRTFIGIRVEPNDEVKQMLRELDSLGYVKTVEPENLHLNLKFLGEIDQAQEKELELRLEKLAGFGPFEVDCAGIERVPSKKMVRVVMSRCHSDKLEELRSRLRELMDDFLPGSEKDSHLTLGRVKRKPDEKLDEFVSRHSQFYVQVRVSRVELIKAELLPNGPVYSTVFSAEL